MLQTRRKRRNHECCPLSQRRVSISSLLIWCLCLIVHLQKIQGHRGFLKLRPAMDRRFATLPSTPGFDTLLSYCYEKLLRCSTKCVSEHLFGTQQGKCSVILTSSMCWADETVHNTRLKSWFFSLLRNRTESQFFELLSWASQLKSKSDDKLLNCYGLTDH